MSNTAIALLGFTSWTLLLASTIAMMRGFLSMKGDHALNSYSPDGADVSAFSNRLCRAHANCLENLPLFAVIGLYALITQQTSALDSLALVLLAARIGQSTIHLISTSVVAVMLRASFFSVQLGLMAWFIFNLI
ncbi:MAG: MAPEG family protein [Gammaproteobacteria bacterium]|nr:MAG: MAPEG family protein [Gammaproteobacteria bacterium]